MELQIGSREPLPQIMFARYYGQASTMRFISVDPQTSSARQGVPQSWNRYTYSLNNPLRYVDETGEDIKMAPGLSQAEQDYVEQSVVDAYQTPTGQALIDSLENNPDVVVYLTAGDLGPLKQSTDAEGNTHLEGASGKTQGDAQSGTFLVTLDPQNQQQLEAAGGDTEAQNVAHELTHVEQALDPTVQNPGDETKPKETAKQVGGEQQCTQSCESKAKEAKAKEILKN